MQPQQTHQHKKTRGIVVAKGLMMKATLPTSADAVQIRTLLPVPLIPGDEFLADEPRFTTMIAARIARTEAQTVRSWGRKYDITKWSEHEKRRSGIPWSVLDLMLLRLMTVMMAGGIHPRDAAWRIGTSSTPTGVAPGTIAAFLALIENPTWPSLFIFHAGGTEKFPADRVSFHLFDPAEPIGEVFARIKSVSHRGEFVLINLRDIIAHVETELAIAKVPSK
jgi:hypothetical protein